MREERTWKKNKKQKEDRKENALKSATKEWEGKKKGVCVCVCVMNEGGKRRERGKGKS